MCTRSIETALSNVDGVIRVNVSLAFNSAHVQYDPSKIRHEGLVDTIENIGYDVVQPQTIDVEQSAAAASTKRIVEFTASGMSCSSSQEIPLNGGSTAIAMMDAPDRIERMLEQ